MPLTRTIKEERACLHQLKKQHIDWNKTHAISQLASQIMLGWKQVRNRHTSFNWRTLLGCVAKVEHLMLIRTHIRLHSWKEQHTADWHGGQFEFLVRDRALAHTDQFPLAAPQPQLTVTGRREKQLPLGDKLNAVQNNKKNVLLILH